MGGLPTCRFCGKQFSRWQTLAQHITQNRCPKHRPDLHAEKHIFDTYDHMSLPLTREAPDRSTAEALETPHPPSSEVDIICNKSEVVAAAQKGLNAFIRLPAVTARLLQTCALCGQWIASHRTMKRHYRYSHSDILHALGGRVRTIIQRTTTACPTCHFCHVQCKDWREHIMKCTVIYQCAVMCLISQDGCRNGAGSVLRGCEAGGQRTQAKAATRGLQGNSRLSSGPVSGDAAPRVLLSHFFGKAACTAGRGDQGVTPGRRMIFFMKPGEHNVLCHLFHTGQQFQKKQAENPGWKPGRRCSPSSASQAGQSLPGGGFRPEGQGLGVEGSGSRLAVPILEPGSSSSKWLDTCKSSRSFQIWCTASLAPND